MDVESNRDRCGLYEFGQFVLDVPERDLTCGATRIHLAPKTFDVLVALVARPRHLVTKREILDRVWPDVFVAEGILTVHVAALRRALGDTRRSPAYIETVSRSGYRFIAEVKYLTVAEAATRGLQRCWRASSRSELTTSGGTA
jgi:DNA-binding winged helix-turn-helix (wHTH) protein